MPAASAVIELYPYHLDHNLYNTLCVNMGVANFPVHAINGSYVFANDPVCT